MKIALLQTCLAPDSRSTNVSRVCRMIDAAAGADPSPDLIVLPEACDTGGAPGNGAAFPQAMTDGFASSVAWKAREWGVYIAAGFHRPEGRKLRSVAALFDPDGDIAIRFPTPERRPDAEAEDVTRLPLRETPLGPWGLCLGSASDGDDVAHALATAGAWLVTVPAAWTGGRGKSVAERFAALSAELGVYVCVVASLNDAATAGSKSAAKRISSGLFSPKGDTLAQCGPGAEAIFTAEIPTPSDSTAAT